MTVKEKISDNNKSPSKDLLLNIRHYTLTFNENVNKINALYNKQGDIKVINTNSINKGYNIITLPIF